MGLIILVGKSASGKTYLANKLSENFRYEKIVTCTTRPIRQNEEDGVDYFFLDDATFEEYKEEGKLVCTTNYNGWNYGLPIDELNKDNKILIIEPIGFYELMSIIPGKIDYTSFYIDCPDRERLIRQLNRGDNIREVFLRNERDTACFQNIEKFTDFVIDANEDEWNCVCAILEGVDKKSRV